MYFIVQIVAMIVLIALIMLMKIEYAFIEILLMRTVFKKMRNFNRGEFEVSQNGINVKIEADYIKEKKEE